MLVGVIITGRHDAIDIAIVVGGVLVLEPMVGIVFGDAISIEQIGHAHDILVATARRKDYSLFFELYLGCLYGSAEAILVGLALLFIDEDDILSMMKRVASGL